MQVQFTTTITTQASLAEDFLKNPDLVSDLVQQRSDAIDTLLNDIWQDFEINNALCLAAVGGYGRRELHFISRVACPTSNPTSHKKARNLDRLC
jgi:UTP:GlnB (protein PII) uridylyltransferase